MGGIKEKGRHKVACLNVAGLGIKEGIFGEK